MSRVGPVGRAGAALVVLLSLGFATSAQAANRLNQIPEPGGCIVVAIVSGCTSAAIGNPSGVAVVGNQVYVSSSTDDTIRIYDRDPATGALTTRAAGLAGCIAETPVGGCADGRGLDGPGPIAASPDGTRLYVGSQTSKSVAVLKRDVGTGNLTQDANTQTCAAPADAECTVDGHINIPTSIAVSSNGQDVYVAGTDGVNNGFVALLDVTAGGVVPNTNPGGCFVATATAGCANVGRALSNASRVVISPDGQNVYVTAVNSHAIAAFARIATGELLQLGGQDGCLEITGGPDGCRPTDLLAGEVAPLTLTSNQAGYVGMVNQAAITMIARNPATGGLSAPGPCAATTPTGVFAGCTTIPYNFFGVTDLEPTPDGNLVAGGRFGRGIDGFTLATDGSPVPVAPPLGCLATGGVSFHNTPCTVPRGFASITGQDFGPNDIALSADGKFVYAASPQGAEDQAGIVVAKRDTADPVCSDATIAATAGQQVSLPLACSDADGDALTRSIVTPPALGATGDVDQASGSVAYAPPADLTGTQTLIFKATSLGIDSAPATVTIQVSQPAPPPPPSSDIARRLSLGYSQKAGEFRGKLGSAELACRRGKVTVFLSKHGKDPKVGSDRTDPKGRYAIPDKGKDGKYYATTGRRTVSAGTCAAAKSRTISLG